MDKRDSFSPSNMKTQTQQSAVCSPQGTPRAPRSACPVGWQPPAGASSAEAESPELSDPGTAHTQQVANNGH